MNTGQPKDERAASRSISLPKGGGAIKGIGETFQANLFSGTGNYTIPLALSPGRNGFGPNLSLQYSSGNGNGPFGLGWQLSIPRITRKTEKGLPRYNDLDVFVMSGAEDLVPCLKKIVDPVSGEETWIPEDPISNAAHTVYRYRPRTEGLFARIERWQHNATAEVHWRAITRDNITSIYGGTSSPRIANPEDESQVYEWLLQETFDAYGNHVLYEYARDNPQLYSNEEQNHGLNEIFERNRQATQLYIRRIYYGNLPDPLLDDQGQLITYPDGTEVGHLRGGRRYAFEVIFDYGDWDVPTKEPHPGPLTEGQQELFGQDPSVSSEHNAVPIRDDRFSTFRSRFEVRTLRRCRRVLMFHHFAELGSATLVRSTNFDYHNDPDTLISFLSGVTVTGYQKSTAGDYRSASTPPVTFKYSEFKPGEQRYQSLSANGNDMPPVALDDPNVAMVDLFGDGLPDVLQSSDAGFRYWRNLGGGLLDRPRSMPQVPAGLSLAQHGVCFGDMGGDGHADLLVHTGPLPGFFETTSNGTWQTFRPYAAYPAFAPDDANVRLIDLTGDGRSDALLTESDSFLWFECLGEQGFAPPERIARKHDLDQFPNVFFDETSGRVRLADMTGDGLSDIVLVHNGRIDYWPNLGYGRFGGRITMADAPHLETDFDPGRLFLADLNGTGCTDLVYVGFDRVDFWFNQSGNRWSETHTITGTPFVTDADSIRFADVFGTGTTTLVWSYDYSRLPESNYKALDFCGVVKPYVLTEMSNNMGATTKVSYAPSTRHFLADQADGNPWVTKLPFPVQIVDKVEVIDHISKTKLVTTYKYHHGYFDGREREFRGFGRVDQFDTETFEDFSEPGLHGSTALFDNNAAPYYVAPVETRSWFHTGIYFDEDSAVSAADQFDYRDLTERLRAEFDGADASAFPFNEHDVQTGVTPHEAYRALRGALLRTEVYARDGSAKSEHPYGVTENRYKVTQLQPKDGNHHAVYFSYKMESLSYQYERNPADPRINHALTLEVDEFGNTLKSLTIGYGRRQPDAALPTQADRDKQTRTHITYSENSYTNAINGPALDPNSHRTPLPCEARSYELTGFGPSGNATHFSFEEWAANDFARLKQAVEIGYEETANFIDEQKRLIEHGRTYYRKNDLTGVLPLGKMESLALPGEGLKLAYTPDLLTRIYGNRVTDSMLASDGGYKHSEGNANWWLPSERVFFSPEVSDTPAEELAFAQRHFFLPCRAQDPFGHSAFSKYDLYDLLLNETLDALGNRTLAEHDYRLLQPIRMTDANGNRSAVAFDTLGLVIGTAVMGKITETKGDSLEAFEPDLTAQELQEFFAEPLAHAEQILGGATTRIVYDLDQFRATQQPVYAATIVRETHLNDPLPPNGLKTQVSFSYSDGFGREVQKKLRAEPGPIVEGGVPINPRWVASGWTIFNNKGKPVKQYEPFFDSTHQFRFANKVGVSSTLFYDPLERVVATLHPNHCLEKVRFDPWQEESWDVNDTVLITDPVADPDVGGFFRRLDEEAYLPTWYRQRQGAGLGIEQEQAAAKTAVHAATPSIAHADSLGRTFLAIAHNRFAREGSIVDETYATRTNLDIEGNQREVIDALDRIVMRYDFDMLGNQIHQASMEAGDRWVLNDVTGKPIRAWDSRGHMFRTEYDHLRRPIESALSEGAQPEVIIGRTVYGETLTNPEAENLRGKVVKGFDQAGIVTNDKYDFKGNLLSSQRQLASNYKTVLNWSATAAPVPLEDEVFTSETRYDALNRVVEVTTPHTPSTKPSIVRPTYNEANLLDRIEANLLGEEIATPFMTDIDYDAKGQRQLIIYGNDVQTTYDYDPLTFRLIGLRTTRPVATNGLASKLFTEPGVVQDLHYTYDPSGNITRMSDKSLARLSPAIPDNDPSDYVYDAVYRLIEATGREHIGQTAHDFNPPDHNRRDYPYAGLADFAAHGNDLQAMRRYIQRYEYDAVGNFQFKWHNANGGSWTLSYDYEEESLLETGKLSNRLTRTRLGNSLNYTETYSYKDSLGRNVHGCMTAMNDMKMEWDFKDELKQVDLGGGGTAYYVYDASGQRTRKVIESQNGARVKECIYLGGFEVYREFNGNGSNIKSERETLHVMDDKQRIALVETKTIENGTTINSPSSLKRYQLNNHLGSASVELNQLAQLISYEENHPYGTTSFQANDSAAELSLKRYRHTGGERDEETGFAYHGARYYAPWLARWTSADPAGVVDGPNLYRYSRNSPLRWADPGGRQPAPDPNAPPTFVGPGITIGGGKVRVGPTMPGPLSECDELNPACKRLTFPLPGTDQPKPQSQPSPEPSSQSSSPASAPANSSPMSWLKPFGPPLPDYTWRITDPSVDPLPYELGMQPKNPNASFSLGEHAAGDYPASGTQYLSGSHKPGGAENFRGEGKTPYSINPDSLPPDTTVHDTPAIDADYARRVREGEIVESRHQSWQRTQRTTEGVPTKPGQPPKGEVLIEGNVPAQAIEGAGLRAFRFISRGLLAVGIASTVNDMKNAALESIREGSIRPILRETVRQATTWGLALSMGADGAAIGFALGGPVGAVFGGFVGSAVGAISGWIAGSWLSSLF